MAFKFKIQEVFNVANYKIVLVGVLEEGTTRVGDVINIPLRNASTFARQIMGFDTFKPGGCLRFDHLDASPDQIAVLVMRLSDSLDPKQIEKAAAIG